MKIALIGYGKMGHIIEQIALNRGHQVVATIDIDNQQDFDSEAFRSADVAIEFTRPQTAVENVRRCFQQGVPVVCGTTGWYAALPEVSAECVERHSALFYASNFSIGVNLFLAANKYLAHLMNRFETYDVRMDETHHIHKLDSPSGTAITLAEAIVSELDRKQGWVETAAPTPQPNIDKQLPATAPADRMGITAYRRDEVPGTHTVIYDSEVDTITFTHEAKSRAGFALGAVVAAEFLAGKQGVFTMSDLLKL
jgi:4-hydroxy-tetrahydrodipicolinate reductase